MKSVILGALACLGAASAACAGTTLVVPGQYANAEAPSQAVLILHGDTHLQFQYAASSFGDAPLTLDGVQFRYDAIVKSTALRSPLTHLRVAALSCQPAHRTRSRAASPRPRTA